MEVGEIRGREWNAPGTARYNEAPAGRFNLYLGKLTSSRVSQVMVLELYPSLQLLSTRNTNSVKSFQVPAKQIKIARLLHKPWWTPLSFQPFCGGGGKSENSTHQYALWVSDSSGVTFVLAFRTVLKNAVHS